MKQALCVNSIEDIVAVYGEEEAPLQTVMVPRDVCEDSGAGYLQLIPYVVFYTNKEDEGKVTLLHYKRPDEGEGEERLRGWTSLGFGGHIDDDNDISPGAVVNTEEEYTGYTMSLNQLNETLLNTARREVKEELGVNLDDYFDGDLNDITFPIYNPEGSDVDKVHVGFLMLVEVTPEQLEELINVETFDKEEIEEIGPLNLNVAEMMSTFDFTKSLGEAVNTLSTNNTLENWSLVVVEILANRMKNTLAKGITGDDIIKLHKSK